MEESKLHWRQWENVVNANRLKFGASPSNAFDPDASTQRFPYVFHTSDEWNYMDFQDNLVVAAYSSMLLSLGLAFIVLLAFTSDFIVSTLAVLSIGMVVVNILAFTNLCGWSLGVIESINLAVLVGMSVDYVVHLAHSYTSSMLATRTERVRQALIANGGAIVSGSVTTLSAAFFLVIAQNQFFFKFGAYLLATIGLAIIYSLGFFGTLCELSLKQAFAHSLRMLTTMLLSF
jgi:predicted RND superfamily exporter protein